MIQTLEQFLFGTAPIEYIQHLIGLGHPLPFTLLSLLGDTWGIMLIVGVAMWFGGRRTTYALLGLIVAAAVTKELLSHLFGLPRPQGPEITVYEELEVTSFPSGHVYQMLAPWALLYVYDRVPLLVPLFATVLVGISRLYLGVHYVGDIFFAVLFALLLVWGYQHVWPRVAPWFAQRSLAFYLVLGLMSIGGIVLSMFIRLNNPRRWEILGMVIGAAIGLIAENRYLCYRPSHRSWQQKAAKIALGVAGIVFCLVVDRLFPPSARVPGLFTAGAAVLWAVFGAPALFAKLGRVDLRS